MEGTVLVIGDRGLALVDPTLLRRLVIEPYTRVLLAPGPHTPAARIEEWRAAGFEWVVAPADLGRALLESSEEPIVVRVPDSSWVPALVGDGSVAADLLRAVPRVRRPRVEEWAERAGTDPRTLRARCRACFGVPPGQLLWMRTDALIRQERARGIPVEVVARVAGFRDRHAMYHAYHDRRLPFPPAGPTVVAPSTRGSLATRTSVENHPAESESHHLGESAGVVLSKRPADELDEPTDEIGRPDAGPPAPG